jgi:hypothetical protein
MRTKENDRRIRNRFIHSLGIIEDTTNVPGKPRRKLPASHRNILKEATFEMPLKNHCSLDTSGRRRIQSNPPTTERSDLAAVATTVTSKPRIQFNSVVQVKPIPSHVDYSDRVRKHLWSNRHEIRQAQQRNMREFAFEGWNYSTVLEEDDMFFDTRSLEFVHPAHLAGYW